MLQNWASFSEVYIVAFHCFDGFHDRKHLSRPRAKDGRWGGSQRSAYLEADLRDRAKTCVTGIALNLASGRATLDSPKQLAALRGGGSC